MICHIVHVLPFVDDSIAAPGGRGQRPEAALTNDKLSGDNGKHLVFREFWRAPSRLGAQWAETKRPGGLLPLEGLRKSLLAFSGFWTPHPLRPEASSSI